MTFNHDAAPKYSGAPYSTASFSGTDYFFLDDAALPTLQQLAADSGFTARGFLEHTGNEQSRTGKALLSASTQWAGVLDSTAQAYSQHLRGVADFVRAAFRIDTETETAL